MKKMKSLDISHSPMQLPVPKRSLAKNSSSSSQVKLQPSKRILDLNSRKNSDLHSKKEKVEVCQSREASCAKRTPPERAVESPQNRRQARPTRLVRESLSPGQSSASEAPLPYQNFSAKDMKRKGGSRRRRFLGARNGGPGGAMGLWASPVTKDPNRRFRSSKKSLVVHSVNSTHKKSRNTLTENYLSSQFNVSSRPGSNEQVSFVVSSHKKQFSNFSVPQELRKAQRPRRPNEPALSQKFLEVPCRGEYSMAKQKRVKSQVQMQTDKDKLNFTSINRIERDARESRRQHSRYYPVQTGSRQSQSIHSYEEEPSSPSKRDADSDFSRTNTSPEDCRVKRFAYEPSFAGAETVLEELEADEGTREANEEDFFYEQLGNIYCKRVEDYCADCRLVLQQIRRKCESCDASGGGISSKEAAAPSEADAEDDCSDTCLNCWNALASFAENCPQCGDETGTRSRNITFGNQIMIRKRSSANQIGETLVDFDERFKAGLLGAGRGPESGKGDRGKRAPDAIMRSPLLPKKAFAREGLKGRRQKEPERVRTSDAKRDLCIHIPGEGFSAGDSAREKKNKFKWVAEPRNQSYHTHSNSGEHHLAEHFDLRDPYLIRSRPEDVPALRDPGLPEIRKKAISNTLPQRRSRKKHFENSEAKKGRLGKKISILKSKKNSIKRADVFKKKHRGQGGGRKKKHICLDMSQNPSKLRHLEAEPVALKSCSMKNTVTKFRFDNPVQMRNFELRPKFRQAETAANDSRREQSINLIYKGKARLRRNHTTKLLRNISCHRDNHLELNYGQKDMPRIYEKKNKRTLASGLRNQIQSRKKQASKPRKLGPDLGPKKPRLKKSELLRGGGASKHSRSFRRNNSKDAELKNSFHKSNESFYHKKKNQSLAAKHARPKRAEADTLSLDKKAVLGAKYAKKQTALQFIDYKKLDRVLENEDENVKCASNDSWSREASRSWDQLRNARERSKSRGKLSPRLEVSPPRGLKRSTKGKLLKMCINAKDSAQKDSLRQKSPKPSEARRTALHSAKSRLKESHRKERSKFLTLKQKTQTQSPESKRIGDEMKLLYQKKKPQTAHCRSLNTSQKQIIQRLPAALELPPLIESKMIDSRLEGAEAQVRSGKMANSLAVPKHSRLEQPPFKNYSMFQETGGAKPGATLNTPRVSKHELVSNLYQPQTKQLGARAAEQKWRLSQVNKSREKVRESIKRSKDAKLKRKNNLKHSKKGDADNDRSSGMSFVDLFNQKAKQFQRYQNTINPRVKKYIVKRIEHAELRRAVLKDRQTQKANYEKIIKDFQDKRSQRPRRTTQLNHRASEAKFVKKAKPLKHKMNSHNEMMSAKMVSHEPAHSFNHEMYLQRQVVNTSVNNHMNVAGLEVESGEFETRPKERGARTIAKRAKVSLQKEARVGGHSQKEIFVPRDFKHFNKQVRSREGFDVRRDLQKAATQKESVRAQRKDVFQAATEKFKNMEQGFQNKMNLKKTQLFNKRTLWRDNIISHPISCVKKVPGLRHTKSRKKLNNPELKMLVGKMKHSFLNKHKFETDLDKKLTRTNKKDSKSGLNPHDQSNKSKNQTSETQNKPVEQSKTLTKVKSKLKLDRMLKNRNFAHKAKNKINLSSQFKVFKKSVGKNNFNKEQELEEDKQKYLSNFKIIQFLGKGSYAEVHLAYDKGR